MDNRLIVHKDTNPVLPTDIFTPLLSYITHVDLEKRFVRFELPDNFQFDVIKAHKYICPGNKTGNVVSGTVTDDALLMYFYNTLNR